MDSFKNTEVYDNPRHNEAANQRPIGKSSKIFNSATFSQNVVTTRILIS